MAEQANSYAPYENRGNVPAVSSGNPSESYGDMAALNAHEATHPPHTAAPHALQTAHPHQPMYQMGVTTLHDGNVHFPPQNLYIPPLSQTGQILPPQASGYLGQGLSHPSLVYTNAGLGMPNLHPQSMMATAGGMMHNPYFPRPQMIRSGSSPTSGGGSPSPGSEDSDDSNHLAQARMKRPSPEVVTETIGPTKGKKPRVSKKSKKKKDPNEPQKPVSAYALFFRDTQASIKTENPNASFGEVSKIVASMWDSLESEQKNQYKRRTEMAKKDYLKKLAAYRATLVSQGEGDATTYSQAGQPYGQLQGPPTYGYPVTTSAGQMPNPQGHSPPQLSMPKKSPLLNSMMTPDAQQSLMNPPMSQPMPPSAPSMMPPMGSHGQVTMSSHSTQPSRQTMVQGPHLSQINSVPPSSPYMTQTNPSLSSPVSSMGSDGSPVGHTMHNAHQQPQQLSPHATMAQQSPHTNMQQPSPPLHPTHHNLQNQASVNHQPQNQGSGPLQVPNATQMCNGSTCLRSGCNNPAVNNPEWEEEYCSNECVVSHCRDVFGTWVATNPQNTAIYPAPVK